MGSKVASVAVFVALLTASVAITALNVPQVEALCCFHSFRHHFFHSFFFPYYSYYYPYSYYDMQSQYGSQDQSAQQLQQLQNDNTALKQQMDSLKGQVDSANKQLTDAKGQFSQQLSDLQAQNRALQASMDAMRQQDAAMIDSIRTQNNMLIIGAAVLSLAFIGAIFFMRRGTVVHEGRGHRGNKSE